MPRELPKIDLHGDMFTVDLTRRGLVYTEAKDKVLLFDQMRHHRDIRLQPEEANDLAAYSVYRFFYDHQKKAIVDLPQGATQMPASVVYMEVLNESYLDPMGMAMEMGISEGSIPRKFLQPRHHLGRVIPTTRIAGEDFFIDLARGEIRHISDSSNKLSGRNVIITPDTEQLLLLVDPATARLHDGPTETADEESMIVFLPPLEQLDRIGYERMHGSAVGFIKETLKPVKIERNVLPQKEKRGRKI